MNKTLLLPLLMLLASAHASAQYNTIQNKIWVFGKNAGLNFSSGTPVPFHTGIDQAEGCASVSSLSGDLLFYTDGKKVFNRSHLVMASGGSLASFNTVSTTQAALIAPVIGSPNQYYLFSLEHAIAGSSGLLVYSIVDMSLAFGLGDVVAGSIGTIVEDSLSEKMIAVRGNSNNVWLLTHRKDTSVFLAYEITSAGLSTTPVVSVAGTLSEPLGYAIGVMKASPDRRRIVSQTFAYGPTGISGTELFDFDPATGIVSNCIVLDSTTSQYGAEFSPDSRKLYVQQSVIANEMKIHQYDLVPTDPALIRASKIEIASITTANVTDLKLGPDNKIYMFGTDDSTKTLFLGYSRFLDCITAPDLPSTACGYVPHVVQLPAGQGMRAGLPNVYVVNALTGETGVQEINAHPSIALYPNPANTQLTISASEKITQLSIINALGQEVYTHTYNAETARVDVGMLSAGVYFARVNGAAVRQFVKE